MSIVCIESESTMKSIGFLIVFFLYLYDVNGECSLGDYRPFPGNCSKFYECINGQKVAQICLAGFHWSKDLETCNWPEIANCGTEPGECLSIIDQTRHQTNNCFQFLEFVKQKIIMPILFPLNFYS